MANRSPLVSSAATIRVADQTTAQALARSADKDWQKRAWAYVDLLGELSYALITYLGNSLAQMSLFIAQTPERGAEPVVADNAPTTATEALERLDRNSHGHGELLRDMAVNLSIPGECFLVGMVERDSEPELWDVASIDELAISSDGSYTWRGSPGETGRKLTDADTVIRAWLRHPRWSQLATSPMRSLLPVCEQIVKLELAINALAVSRLGSSKVLLVPESASFGSPDPATDNAQDGEERKDPVNDAMMQAFITPIANPGSASAVAPIILRPPENLMDKIRMLDFDRPIDDTLDRRLELALKRLAQGLPVPPEVVMGFQSVKYSNALIIDQQTLKSHIEPFAAQIMVPFTRYLRGALEAGGMSADETRGWMVWFDPSRLVSQTNRVDDAKEAHKELLISDEAARRELGFDEEDKPEDEEILRRIGIQRGLIDPALTGLLVKLIARSDPELVAEIMALPTDRAGSRSTRPSTAPAAAETPTRNGGPAPIAAAGGPDIGAELEALDRALRDRIDVAADAAMRRTLERAGARLASAAKRNPQVRETLRNVPPILAAARLGPTLTAELGVSDDELLEEGFDGLGAQFDGWMTRTQRQALDYLRLSDSERADAEHAQDQARVGAWSWYRLALLGLARGRLYDPHPAVERGEADVSLLVGYGYTRGAVSRAGGARGFEELVSGLLIIGGRPAGGVGTGELMRGLVTTQGGSFGEYRWEYGVYPRDPFDPHLRLNGLVFSSFTDERLRNFEGWPPVAYFNAGDHASCRCSIVPAVTLPASAVAAAYDPELVLA
jgi:hypothetical protein